MVENESGDGEDGIVGDGEMNEVRRDGVLGAGDGTAEAEADTEERDGGEGVDVIKLNPIEDGV